MQNSPGSFMLQRTFIGVVEDRNDPLQLGRVKVRAYSIHTEDKSQTSTKDLPWAMVLQPNNAAISGVGYSGTGLIEGTWVFGLFLDENDYQNPLVLGSLHGKPALGPDPTVGFFDPKGVYPKDDSETHKLGESSVSRLAKGRKHAEKHTVMVSKREGKDLLGKVDTAKAQIMGAVLAKRVLEKFQKRDQWEEPHPRTGGKDDKWFKFNNNYSTYPFCHVWYTESGHALEVDDTPGAERLHMYHRSGTFQEIQDTGDKIEKIVGDDYEIDLKNKRVYVKGDYTVTVDGDSRELVHGDKYVEVDGKYFVTVRKDYVKKVQGNETKEILSDRSVQINGNNNERVSKNFVRSIVGAATEQIKGTFTKTTTGEEKRTNLSSATHVLPDNYVLMGANNLTIAAGGNLTVKADGQLNLRSGGNTVATANTGYVLLANTGTMDIDAPTIDVDAASAMTIDSGSSMTIDSPTLSIDGPDGNITSKGITLHDHVHEGSPTAGQGAKSDTGAPK